MSEEVSNAEEQAPVETVEQTEQQVLQNNHLKDL